MRLRWLLLNVKNECLPSALSTKPMDSKVQQFLQVRRKFERWVPLSLWGVWEVAAKLLPGIPAEGSIGAVVSVVEGVVVVEVILAPGEATLLPEESALNISKAHHERDTVLVAGVTDDAVGEDRITLKSAGSIISYLIHRWSQSKNRSSFRIRLNPVWFVLKMSAIHYNWPTTVIVGANDAVGTGHPS